MTNLLKKYRLLAPAGISLFLPSAPQGLCYLLDCVTMFECVIITTDKHTIENHHVWLKLSVWKSLLRKRE